MTQTSAAKGQGAPLLSFIVPFWASHNHLLRCLTSIQRHTSVSHEIWLVDDGNPSYDFSAVAAVPGVHIHHVPDNRGPSFCRNLAIKQASGRYIQFVDSDDMLIADPVEYIEAAASCGDGADADAIVGALEGSSNTSLGPKLPFITTLAATPRLAKLSAFTAALYKTDFLQDRMIAFPEQTKNAEDTVFLARVFAQAEAVAITNIVNYRYLRADGTLSRRAPSWAFFETRFGSVAEQTLAAYNNHETARIVRGSMMFKHGVKYLQDLAPLLDTTQWLTAARMLASIAEQAGILSSEADDARQATAVYWDTALDRCASMLLRDAGQSLQNFLVETEIKLNRQD